MDEMVEIEGRHDGGKYTRRREGPPGKRMSRATKRYYRATRVEVRWNVDWMPAMYLNSEDDSTNLFYIMLAARWEGRENRGESPRKKRGGID
jgi:hypothetical protein